MSPQLIPSARAVTTVDALRDPSSTASERRASSRSSVGSALRASKTPATALSARGVEDRYAICQVYMTLRRVHAWASDWGTVDVTGLYRGPREDFIARRTALVRTLRPADPDAAAAAGRIRKPPSSVWAIDQLAAEDPELIAELLAAGADARRAQQAVAADTGSAEDLLLASGRLRDLVEAALRAAVEARDGGDHAAGEDTLRKIRTTLQAAATGSADQRLALWSGTLDRELDPAGFGALSGGDDDAPELAAILAPLRRGPSTEPGGAKQVRPRPARDIVERRAAERAVAEHNAAAERARATAESRRQQAQRLAAQAQMAEADAVAAERAAELAEEAALRARNGQSGSSSRRP